MKFIDITDDLITTPGEYILHEPTGQIVMCGSFSRQRNQIRAMGIGRMIEDTIENFKKIELTVEERHAHVRRCKGCGGL